jgi:hypothetical protein
MATRPATAYWIKTRKRIKMDTVRMMWSMSKGLTIATFIALAVCLVLVGWCWWLPIAFGYPFYSVLLNLVPTGIIVLGVINTRNVIRR